MANKKKDIFYQCRDESNTVFKNLENEREVFVTDIKLETDLFFKAIQTFVGTGKINAEALKIDVREVKSERSQENDSVKAGKTRKKNFILTDTTEDNIQEVKIKKEKKSEESVMVRSANSSTASSIAEIKEIGQTKIGNMPAPNWIPPKKKNKEIKAERSSVRITRTKGRKASETSKVNRDSDVVIQNAPITTISLSDTDESDFEKLQKDEVTSRSTRTKTKNLAHVQTDSGAETDTENSRRTRTKTAKSKREKENAEFGEVEDSRRTRTKTIRKEKTVENENKKDDTEEIPQEIRSTRTRTIRKGPKEPEVNINNTNHEEEHNQEKKGENENKNDEPEETAQTVRTTRTKTLRKAAKEPEENIGNNNNEDKVVQVIENTRSTRTKTRKLLEKNIEGSTATNEGQKTKENPVTDGLQNIPNLANQGNSKRNRPETTDEETDPQTESKKPKSNSPFQENETDYEDAQSTLVASSPQIKNRQLNSTFVTSKPPPIETNKKLPQAPLNSAVTIESQKANGANCNIVLEKPNFNIFDKTSINGMFTDDESFEAKTPPKITKSKATKEVFSPYEKSTLKKKVEAFEKLQKGSDIPIRNTSVLRPNKDTPSKVKEKAKFFTPTGSKFIPGSCSTSKISRLLSCQQTSINNESLAAMKSVQKQSRDRQKKLEREQALLKKEAMLQAAAEAKRKLNEEKQLRAQQQRKALEAEKQKQVELQKQKEERLKQREIEREQYLIKQKLEIEKKRLAQKKQMKLMQAQFQQIVEGQKKNPPIYMTTKLPKLPTEDCYDSDDPEYKEIPSPSWCTTESSRTMQLSMIAAGEKIKNTLFCRHAQTPDLTEIFEDIDPRKLKRSSSVQWKQPPRYTMLPDLNETRFSEDEEVFECD